MSRPISPNPHCVGCNRTRDEVPGMFSLKQGGMPTHICWDCVDELHAKAWIYRHPVDRVIDDGVRI